MTPTIAPYAPTDNAVLRQLATDPSLAYEFDHLQGADAIERKLADPYIDSAATSIAHVDGQPAGFAFMFKLGGTDVAWNMIRIGIVEAHRRKGIGSRLLEDALAGARTRHPDSNEAIIGSWAPNEAFERFAAHHGFRHIRNFWLMVRPLVPVAPYAWPNGVTVRTFDGSDRDFHDWNDVYNRSFADHWHFVLGTDATNRHIAADSHFRPDGLFLAYRDGKCVGFTRNLLRDHEGEVALIGTAPEARGIGLGRALLRQAVAWIQEQRVPRVVLRVDGENENALSLYRSEGFATERTRAMWSKPLR